MKYGLLRISYWARSPDVGDVGVGAGGGRGRPQIRGQRGLVSSALGAQTRWTPDELDQYPGAVHGWILIRFNQRVRRASG